MTSFLLIPGAGGMASYWHRVAPLLEKQGHHATAVDLPGDDNEAGLEDYAALARASLGRVTDAVIVAQSLGGFTAALVAAGAPVRALVFANAMIPLPGETPGAWFENTGARKARVEAATHGGYATEFDDATYFLHDVPAGALQGVVPREEAQRVFGEPCRFERWPDVPMHVIAGAGDRFFPAAFQKRVARERLGIEAELIDGGHLLALANPVGLVTRLVALAEA